MDFALYIAYVDRIIRHDKKLQLYPIPSIYSKSLRLQNVYIRYKTADWRPWQHVRRVTTVPPNPFTAGCYRLAGLSTPRASSGPVEVPETSFSRSGEVVRAQRRYRRPRDDLLAAPWAAEGTPCTQRTPPTSSAAARHSLAASASVERAWQPSGDLGGLSSEPATACRSVWRTRGKAAGTS